MCSYRLKELTNKVIAGDVLLPLSLKQQDKSNQPVVHEELHETT